LQFLNSNKFNNISEEVNLSREKLISIFNSANNDLRTDGLLSGLQRFNDFCTILFLKLFNEKEELKAIEAKKFGITKPLPDHIM
jgi:hypothetical protein